MYNEFPSHIRFSSLRQDFVPSAFHVGFLAVGVATDRLFSYLLVFSRRLSFHHRYVFIHCLLEMVQKAHRWPQHSEIHFPIDLPATTDKINNIFKKPEERNWCSD